MCPVWLLRRPPLPLCASPCISFPPPPQSDRGDGAALARGSATPEPAGGCSGGLLWTSQPCAWRPGLWLHRDAAAAPAWRPGQGIVPQSQHGVEGLWSISGRPHPLLVLPAAGRGTVHLRPSPSPNEDPAEITGDPVEIHLPPLCNSTCVMDVPSAVSACTLPQVPCTAAGRGSGLLGVEGAISGVVQTQTKLGQSRFARRGIFYHHKHWETATVGFISEQMIFDINRWILA